MYGNEKASVSETFLHIAGTCTCFEGRISVSARMDGKSVRRIFTLKTIDFFLTTGGIIYNVGIKVSAHRDYIGNHKFMREVAI